MLNPLTLLELVRLNRLDLLPLAEIGTGPVGQVRAQRAAGGVKPGDTVPVLTKKGESATHAIERVGRRYR